MNTARPFLVWALCWKQRRRGKLSQQSDGLRAVYRMVANGKWPSRLRFARTNYLELLAVFVALKHFLPFLHDCHILISSDSSTTIPYITHQREAVPRTHQHNSKHYCACVTSLWCPHESAADEVVGSSRFIHDKGQQRRKVLPLTVYC